MKILWNRQPKGHRLGARTYGVPFGGSGFPSLWAWLLVFGVATKQRHRSRFESRNGRTLPLSSPGFSYLLPQAGSGSMTKAGDTREHLLQWRCL